MSDFINGFKDYLAGKPEIIIYDIIIFIFVSILCIVIMRVYIRLRLWHNVSKLRRSTPDEKAASDYIEENKKPLNKFQRFMLAQTGHIFSKDDIIPLLFTVIVACVSIWFFSIIRNTKMFKIIWVGIIVFYGLIWLSEIPKFIKYNRLLSFAIWTLILAFAIFDYYIFFCV